MSGKARSEHLTGAVLAAAALMLIGGMLAVGCRVAATAGTRHVLLDSQAVVLNWLSEDASGAMRVRGFYATADSAGAELSRSRELFIPDVLAGVSVWHVVLVRDRRFDADASLFRSMDVLLERTEAGLTVLRSVEATGPVHDPWDSRGDAWGGSGPDLTTASTAAVHLVEGPSGKPWIVLSKVGPSSSEGYLVPVELYEWPESANRRHLPRGGAGSISARPGGPTPGSGAALLFVPDHVLGLPCYHVIRVVFDDTTALSIRGERKGPLLATWRAESASQYLGSWAEIAMEVRGGTLLARDVALPKGLAGEPPRLWGPN